MKAMTPSEDGPQVVQVVGIESQMAMGTPHVSISAAREWLVEGYRRALVRFRAASEQGDKSAEETFLPLFEALNWIVAIQDSLRDRGEPLDKHALLRALRIARNRVHHAWAAALEVQTFEVSSRLGPVVMEGTTFDWFGSPARNFRSAETAPVSESTGNFSPTSPQGRPETFSYGAYKTYQVPLRRIEGLTQLSFGSLVDADPLERMEVSTSAREVSRLEELIL